MDFSLGDVDTPLSAKAAVLGWSELLPLRASCVQSHMTRQCLVPMEVVFHAQLSEKIVRSGTLCQVDWALGGYMPRDVHRITELGQLLHFIG